MTLVVNHANSRLLTLQHMPLYCYSSQLLTLEHIPPPLLLSLSILTALHGTYVSILQTPTFLQFKTLENSDILIQTASEFKVTLTLLIPKK